MAILWLTVFESHWGPGYGFPSELWSRRVEIEGTPKIRDEIMLLRSAEEPEGCITHQIKHRYWDWDGTLNLELRDIVHLPNEKYEEDFNRGIAACSWDGRTDWEKYVRQYPSPWREEDDEYGVLNDRLRLCGWKPYDERKL